MQIIKKLILISALILSSQSAFASPGRLNSEGCHTDKETKNYHCHDKSKSGTAKKESKSGKKKSGKKKEVEAETQTQE